MAMRETVLKLIEEFNGDSKRKSKAAEKKLLKICIPIIKNLTKITDLFDYNLFDDASYYLPNRGTIDEIVFADTDEIQLVYSDGCLGDVYEEVLIFPLSWLDINYERFFYNCREKKLKDLENDMSELKKQLSQMDTNYKQVLSMHYTDNNSGK